MTVNTTVPAAGTVDAILYTVATLDDECFSALHAEISGEQVFLSDQTRVSNLSSKIGISVTDTLSTLTILGNIHRLLYDPQETDTSNAAAVVAKLDDIFDDLEVFRRLSEYQKLVERLAELFIGNSAADHARKVVLLGKGFLPSATGFRSIVDLRPVFTPQRDKISDFTVSVQLLITTDDDTRERIVLHLDDTAIAQLRETLEHLVTKIEITRKECERLTAALGHKGVA
jgi:hypothetical protein